MIIAQRAVRALVATAALVAAWRYPVGTQAASMKHHNGMKHHHGMKR